MDPNAGLTDAEFAAKIAEARENAKKEIRSRAEEELRLRPASGFEGNRKQRRAQYAEYKKSQKYKKSQR